MAIKEVIAQNEYLLSLTIFIGAIIVAKVSQIVIARSLKKFVNITKNDADDKIVDILAQRMDMLIIVSGLFIALRRLSVLVPYSTWINGLFFVMIVIIASLVASEIITVLVNHWFKIQRKFGRTPRLINKVIVVFIFSIALLMILSHFEVEITPLIATLGLGGLAVGLALQNTLTNFFAGLHIISDRPVNVGDFIHLADVDISGYVEDIGWRSTRIKTLPNTIVIIPNGKLAESIIINDSLPEQEMAALVQCGVGYGSDLKKVEKVTIEVARKIQKTVPGATKGFEPFIRYHTFGDSNINFTVILRVNTFVDKYLVTHEFIKTLKERYDKEAIEISWPMRKIVYGDEPKKRR